MAKALSNEEIIAKCNAVARESYRSYGLDVPEGYRFDQSEHLLERALWNLAVVAFDTFHGTDAKATLLRR